MQNMVFAAEQNPFRQSTSVSLKRLSSVIAYLVKADEFLSK